MNNKILTSVLMICLLFFSFSNIVFACDEGLNDTHECEIPVSGIEDKNAVTASVIITSGEEFLIEVKANHGDTNMLVKTAMETLLNQENLVNQDGSEISINQIFCCDPNQQIRHIRMDFHLNNGDGTCTTYFQTAKYCPNCGSIWDVSPRQNVRSHPTTSNCP